MRYTLLVVSVLVLVGCGSGQISAIQSTATPTTHISREKAVEAALAIASSSRPEISGVTGEPQIVSVSMSSLGEAATLVFGHTSLSTSQDPNTLVWVINIDGLWLNEAQTLGVTSVPTQNLLRHYTVMLDAETGLEIESRIRP